MKTITEQDIWDLLDGNCTVIQAKHIRQQLQLEEHKELLQMYHTLQVLNSDLQSMEAAQPSANFNAAVMAKLQPAQQAQTATSALNLDETVRFWQPTSKWFLLGIMLLIGLIFLLANTTTSSSDTMGSLGVFIIEGIGQLVDFARHPAFLSSMALIYALGLLTLLDGFFEEKIFDTNALPKDS